jgi:hypothetical protein
VQFDTIEQVVIDGQGGDDDLTATGPEEGLIYVVAPGPTLKSVTVQLDSLVPLIFEHLGDDGSLTVTRTGDDNTLVIVGTPHDDVFELTPTTVTL